MGKELKLSHCVNGYVDNRGSLPSRGQLGCNGFIVFDKQGALVADKTSAYLQVYGSSDAGRTLGYYSCSIKRAWLLHELSRFINTCIPHTNNSSAYALTTPALRVHRPSTKITGCVHITGTFIIWSMVVLVGYIPGTFAGI